jgi:D-3-phosphoglycerate dehydrogenase
VKVVVAGADFPSLAIEERILGEIGTDVVDARGRDRPAALELCRDADGIMSDYFRCDAEAIARLERCRVICLYGVSVHDRVDLAAATAAGIVVTHTPDYCMDELADHTLALLLAVARRVTAYDGAVRGGAWDYNAGRPLHRLRGRTLGIVGFGRAGRAVAERARGFGLRVVATDAYVPDEAIAAAGSEPLARDELLRRSEILTLHAPLTDETRGLIGPAELALLPAGAILVNTARGGLVDQAALGEALASGRLAGAGLDVLAEEPPTPDDPLLALPNVVLTPHAGFLSEESLVDLQTEAAEEVRRALTGGRPRHAVDYV